MDQPIDDELIRALVSYLPPAVARAIHANPHAPIEPRAERFPATVLFADVSGFTAFTERLAALVGPDSVEELTQLLNRYFSRMIGLLEEEGGEVVQFSGDALIAVFPADPDRPSPANLQTSTRRAWQAAARMQGAMTEFADLTTSVGSVALGMKIGIAAGEVLALSVGGVLKRWQYIIAGDPLRQVAEAEHEARRGEIVLSPEAQALFIEQPLPPRPSRPLVWNDVSANTLAALRTHIPGAITYRLMAGQAGWLAELRRMSILFMGVGGLEYASPEALTQIQTTMATFQETVYRYEGSINKLLVDDKGAISIVLFGAPPLSHLDDPLRAVRCAIDLQQAGTALGLRLAIGITTGQVFSGPVGSPTRREYTVIGDVVNLAARLMQLAGRGGILSDHTTFHATESEIVWEALPPQVVKGKAEAVRIYRPLGVASARQSAVATPLLVGRVTEMAWIEQALDQIAAGQARVICLEGEAGIGKSRLVIESEQRARARGLTSLIGSGQAIERQTPYRAWKEIFQTYFDLEELADLAIQRQRVQARLSEIAPELVERAPLLNDLLGLGLPETSLTASLEPKLRQASLQALVVDLLRQWASARPLVLVIEDANWLDSLSWQLALHVARGLAGLPLLLLLALRSPDDLPPDHPYQALRDLPATTRLQLEPLSSAETVALAAARLGATELDMALGRLIEQRSGGIPFVAEELVLSLRDSELISIEDGRGVLKGAIDDLRLPDTVQGLVLSRIDRLPAEQQLTIKVASVIGRVFGYPTLRDIYPAHLGEYELLAHLDSLTRCDMVLPLEDAGALRSHTFKQTIIQEVAYSTLLHAQRRDMHERVARWYELQTGAQQSELYPLLAYHWRHAQQTDRELHYATLAGRKLAAEYANDDALAYLNRALQLARDPAALHEVLWLRIQVYERIGDRRAQHEDLTQLQALVDREGDAKHQAQVANAWAAYYKDISDYRAALKALERAQVAARWAGDRAAEARSLTIGGQVQEFQGALGEARASFEQALEIYRRIGYRRGEANNLSHLGNIHQLLGDHASARMYYLQALEIRRAIGDRAYEATSLTNLSQVSLLLGENEAAAAYHQQALEIARAIGDRSSEALSLSTIGYGHLLEGDYAAARQHLDQALRLFQMLGERRREANSLDLLGHVHRSVGDYASAQSCFRSALTILLQIGDMRTAAVSHLNLGLTMLEDDPGAAAWCYSEALELARATSDREIEGYARSYRAALHERQSEWAAAEQEYLAALAIRGELQAEAAAIEDRAGLGRVALAQGRIDEARQHAQTCLDYLALHGAEGMEFPLLVWMSCYDILRAAGNADGARKALNDAHSLLMARAAAISDPAIREGLLRKVAINRRVIEEWEAQA